ncbi:hypothetical protein BKA65DRAFT_411836, partial [Rhexocercosporidium sp. MPI-PUGE-AT-0058]
AAAEGGHLKVVQRLLNIKADINTAITVNGRTTRTAVQAAAKGGYLEVVQRLFDAKANVNATTAVDKRIAL